MATFNIFQDTEKENGVKQQQLAAKIKQPLGNAAKDKRSTFGVLSNLPNNGPPRQGKKAFRGVKPSLEKKGDVDNAPNFTQGLLQHQKKQQTGIPVEQFKSFSVYEDENREPESCSKELKEEESESVTEKKCANVIQGAIRNPLSEISRRDVLLETPMSVGDINSPMSIDKSLQIDDESKISTVASSHVPRNDRDRFFEVKDYQYCILEYFRELEKRHRPKPSYMRRQPDINYSMRTILVDWLVEVAEEYRMESETLCLAVSYIDRFLSQMSVVRAKLQLVGTAAMFIAAKYEEIYPPDVGEFVFITDDTYTKAQVLRMEQIILKILSFDLSVPTPLVYINTYAVMYPISDQVKFLAIYLCELSLLEGDPYLQYLPSQISSAALALARYTLELPIWCPQLEEITSYSLESLKDIVIYLCRTHNLSIKLAQQAVQEKYKANKYKQIATIKPVEIDVQQFNELLDEYKRLASIPRRENNLSSDEQAASNENVRKMISSLIFV